MYTVAGLANSNLWVFPIAIDGQGVYQVLLKHDVSSNEFGPFLVSDQWERKQDYIDRHLRSIIQKAIQLQTEGIWNRNNTKDFLSLSDNPFYNLLGINTSPIITKSISGLGGHTDRADSWCCIRLEYKDFSNNNKILWIEVNDILAFDLRKGGQNQPGIGNFTKGYFSTDWKETKAAFDKLYQKERFRAFRSTQEYKGKLGFTWYKLDGVQLFDSTFLDLDAIGVRGEKNIWNYFFKNRSITFSLEQAKQNYDKHLKAPLEELFKKNNGLQKALIATGKKILVDNDTSPTFDSYYLCVGPDGTGENMIGQLLMQLRDKYQGQGDMPRNYKLFHLLAQQQKSMNILQKHWHSVIGFFRKWLNR